MNPAQARPEITPSELKNRLDAGEELLILDVREPGEVAISSIGELHIPLGQLPARIHELEAYREEPIVVVCRSGARSGRAVQYLQALAFQNPLNLKGGMMAWRDEVDPSLPVG